MKKSHFHTPSRNKQSTGTGQLTALKDLERFTPENTAHDNQPPEALKTTTNSGLFCHFIIDRFLSSIKAIPDKPGEGFAPQSKVRKAVLKAPPLFVFPFAQGVPTILSSRFQMSTGQELEQSGPLGATVWRRHTLQSPSKGVLSLPKRLSWALIAPYLLTAIRHLEVDGRSAAARRPGKAENAAPQSTMPARPQVHQLAEFSPKAKPRERGAGPGKAWVQTPEDDAQRGRDNGRWGPERGGGRPGRPARPAVPGGSGGGPEMAAWPLRGAALVPGPPRTRRGAGGRAAGAPAGQRARPGPGHDPDPRSPARALPAGPARLTHLPTVWLASCFMRFKGSGSGGPRGSGLARLHRFRAEAAAAAAAAPAATATAAAVATERRLRLLLWLRRRRRRRRLGRLRLLLRRLRLLLRLRRLSGGGGGGQGGCGGCCSRTGATPSPRHFQRPRPPEAARGQTSARLAAWPPPPNPGRSEERAEPRVPTPPRIPTPGPG